MKLSSADGASTLGLRVSGYQFPDARDLDWHMHRAAELHDILQSVAAEDFVVDADGLTIEQAATAIIVRAGWDAATPSP